MMVIIKNRSHRIAIRLILVIIIFAITLMDGPNIISRIFGNIGVLGLLRQTCVPTISECNPDHSTYSIDQSDTSHISRYIDFLQRALKISPGDQRIQVHLAEFGFITGDRAKAVTWLSNVENSTLNRSWLSFKDRYPSFLLAGWQEYLSNRWEGAINQFRLGLFWAGETTLTSDELAYFDSLSNYYRAQGSDRAPDDLLAAIYSHLAGKTDQAKEILTSMLEKSGSGHTDRETMAIAYRYLGLIAAKSNQKMDAEEAFQKSLEYDPHNRLTLLALLQLLTPDQKSVHLEALKDKMDFLGPSYRLGVIGEHINEERPVLVDDDWELVGYDIEDRLVSDSHQLAILLWWKNTGNRPLDASMINTGQYVLKEEIVKNFLPNPGMEWGLDDRGIPVGYDREFYTGNPQFLKIVGVERDGSKTSAFMTENTIDVQNLALASRVIPVNPVSYTLMAGWIYHDDGNPNIGRNCWGDHFTPGGPYYIAYLKTPISKASWIHAADLSTPIPGVSPDLCEVLFINYESQKPAAWDQLLWVNILTP